MQKIYTPDFKTSPENKQETKIGPSKDVLNNILNFSRSLEVLKPTNSGKTGKKNVEIVLN